MRPSNTIRCPKCGRDKDLSIHVSLQATIEIPIVEGFPAPALELLLDVPLSSDAAIARYSDTERTTRAVFYRDDARILINCPHCERTYSLPEGTSIKCNDVE